MAYLPETKDKTAVVSPAAKRVLGPEDPAAREEFDAQKEREFGTMDQIGLAADMLPGGAMAVEGSRKIAETILKVVQSGSVQDAMKIAAKADQSTLKEAWKHLEKAAIKARIAKQPDADEVYDKAKKSIEAVMDLTFDLGRKSKADEHKAAIRKMKREGRKPSVPKKTTDIMATKDLPSETRMKARDMPSPSGKGRLDQKMVEGLAAEVENLKTMSEDELLDSLSPGHDALLADMGTSPKDIALWRRLVEDEIRRRGRLGDWEP